MKNSCLKFQEGNKFTFKANICTKKLKEEGEGKEYIKLVRN